MNYDNVKKRTVKDFLINLPENVILTLYSQFASKNNCGPIFENTDETLNKLFNNPYDAICSAFYGEYKVTHSYVTIDANGNLISSNSLADLIDFYKLAEWCIDNNPCEIRADLEDNLMDAFIKLCLSVYKNADIKKSNAFLYCDLIEDNWDSVMLNIKNDHKVLE